MEQGYRESRLRRGFTMMELLIVVAIIGILAAIAMPNIAQTKRQLEMAKLDEYARQIYLAAQNEAVKMKASWELVDFQKELNDQHSDWIITQKPQDYPDGDDTWKQLYYLSSEEAFTKKYLTHAGSSLLSLDIENGYFILELNPNPTSGDVYSAFYSEHPFTYNDIQNLVSRSRVGRTSDKLGYYCGSSSSAADVLPEKFNPKIEIANHEQLTVKITCPGMLLINSTQQFLTLNISITDESGHIWEKAYKGGTSDLSIVGDKAEFNLLLDGLKPSEDFAHITEEKLTPGDDITITAAFSYDNGDIHINSGDVGVSATDNSLFDYRRSLADNSCEIGVGYVRHLNNLRGSIYNHPENLAPLTVVQTQHTIDFSTVASSMAKFEPINNSVFNNDRIPMTGFDGKGNELRNFIFESNSNSDSCGLFGSVKSCNIKNVRLIDCTVNGQNGVSGALAGFAQNSKIENCGVYLSTEKNSDGLRPDMETKAQTYRIAGSGAVGALIGSTENTSLLNCFSAATVKSSGNGSTGGLVGAMSQGSVTNCYSSGDINVSSGYSGGLIGSVNNGDITNCYTTSNLSSDTGQSLTAGILTGKANAAKISNSIAYGTVNITSDSVQSGFIAASSGTTYDNCFYLKQAKYNDDFTAPSGVSSSSYRSLKDLADDEAGNNTPENSIPYDKTLVGNAFPFLMLTYTQGSEVVTMKHYGNWPPELKLQTSLVYYERYDDGTYGFYAETSLKTSAEGESSQDPNAWTLNSLYTPIPDDPVRDPSRGKKVCVEDGYAIMTPYALTRFEYNLSTEKAQDYPNNKNKKPTNIQIGTNPGESSLLTSDASLTFETMENGKKISYTITGSYIYRLPFNLQMPSSEDKVKSSRFYTQLRVNGYVEDNHCFEDYIFYYCPDFAKNAINPSLGDSDAICPPDPDYNQGDYVYVRSARQLNALGRTPYYWNSVDANNSNREFYFKQEININFSKYDKNYCGQTNIDFMDTSGVYKNSPIGNTNVTSGKNFRYIYDGGGKEIINYRQLNTNNQFCGLFGEIQHATLKNIVMTTELLEGDVKNPLDAPGYIRSSYQNGDYVPGIGGLVGLIYRGKPGDDDEAGSSLPVALVENCSISGYEVSYSNSSYHSKIAIGGLVGFNFGTVKNSTAVNKLVSLETGAITKKEEDKAALGGLVGTIEGDGKIENCYAGGNLKVSSAEISNKVRVGGLCGAGYLNIYGYLQNDGAHADKKEIKNSYSYCNWKLEDVAGATCYPVSPASSMKQNNCYYLDANFDMKFSNDDHAVKQTFDDLSFNDKLTGFAQNASIVLPWPEDKDELKGKPYPFPAIVRNINNDGTLGDYAHYGSWFGVSYKESDAVYLCYYEKYSNGSYGFYYLDEEDNINRSSLDDSDRFDIDKAGYGILSSQAKRFDFYCSEAKEKSPLESVEKLDYAWLEDIDLTYSNEFGLFLYPFTNDFTNEYLCPTNYDVDIRRVGLSYTKKDDTIQQEFYLNGQLAADISHTPDRNGEVRTAAQLQFLDTDKNRFYGKGWNFTQTHNILIPPPPDPAATTGMLQNQAGKGYNYNGNFHTISGLTRPLFNTIGDKGIISNLQLINVNLTEDGTYDIAPFALTNNTSGVIQNCSASGTVNRKSASAAGFVANNAGTISGSYANCTVNGYNAAGFVGSGGGTISQCYADGSVHATNIASGFSNQYWGANTRNSYTISSVSSDSGNAYGFASNPLNGKKTNYWISTNTFNVGISDNSNASVLTAFYLLRSTDTLSNLNSGGPSYPTWILEDQPNYTFADKMPNGASYPYPRPRVSEAKKDENGLEITHGISHYGDWPTDAKAGTIGVYQLYFADFGWVINYMSGCGLNLANLQTEHYTPEWRYSTNYDYGIFFPEEMSDDTLAQWKVTIVQETKTTTYDFDDLIPDKVTYSNKNLPKNIKTYNLPEETPTNNITEIVLTAPDATEYKFTRVKETQYYWDYYSFNYNP